MIFHKRGAMIYHKERGYDIPQERGYDIPQERRYDIPQDASRQLPTMNSTQPPTPEQQAFARSYNTLQDFIAHSLNPDSFANQLYSQNLITKDKRTEAQSINQSVQRKCTLLLEAVETQIKYDPTKFHDFLEILSEDSAMETLSDILRDTYEHQVPPDARLTKPLSHISYNKPLKGKHFENICDQFRKAIMSSNSLEVNSLTEGIENGGNSELHAFVLCYQSLETGTAPCQLDKAKKIVKRSLKIAEAIEGHNRQLLQGRAYRILAGVFRRKMKYKKGLEIIQKGHEALLLAERSSETACLIMEEALLLQLSEPWTPERQDKIEKLLIQALKDAKCCKDHKRAPYTVSLVYLRQALFYLNVFEHKKSASPAPEALHRAEGCLENVNLHLVGGTNIYEMEYYVAHSDLSSYRWNPTEALSYARKAEGLRCESGIADDSYLHVGERLEILEIPVIRKGRETQV